MTRYIQEDVGSQQIDLAKTCTYIPNWSMKNLINTNNLGKKEKQLLSIHSEIFTSSKI